MDHANARLIGFPEEKPATAISCGFSSQDKEETLQRSESEMHNKQQQKLAAYYKSLAGTIRNYDQVLLFGPTSAKTELFNILRKDRLFDAVRLEVLDADAMTDNQQHAFVRDYFKDHDSKA